MEQHLDKLIDTRNKKLWEELNLDFNFTLQESPEPNYMINVQEQEVIICIDSKNINSSAFTHELLHVFLKSKNVLILNDIYDKVSQFNKLHYLFSTDLKNHISNCLEHVIMLPIFLEMGYKNREFLSDFMEPKITDSFITSLESRYLKDGIYDRDSVDVFIGKFFSMKSCNNKSLNYSKYYKILKKLDPLLFKLLEEFWDDWLTYNFEDSNDSYDDILDNFLSDLVDWHENKTII